MKTRIAPRFLLAALLTVSFAAAAAASDKWQGVRPIFTVIPANAPGHRAPHLPAAQLVQWNGSFTDQRGLTVTYTMGGTNPE